MFDTKALKEVARKKHLVESKRLQYHKIQREWKSRLIEVEENLENTVGFVVDNKLASLTAVADELGCSRDRVKGMAKRARDRNRAKMGGKT